MIGGTGSMTPPSDHELPQSPAKSYSQAVAPGSRDLEERFSNVVRYSPMADLQGGVALVDLPDELLSDSKPLWSAYIVGHFMGDAPHIGKVHAIVNRIWSFPDRPEKIDAQFISPHTVFPKTASAQPDLTAVPLWVDLQGEPLPASIKVKGTDEIILVSYPLLPPRCLGCQKWGHTDKTCSKNKHIKEKTEDAKELETVVEGTGTDEAANAQQSSSKDSEEKVRNSVSRVHDSVSNKVSVGLVIPENEEPWLTIPQSSPSGCRNNGKSARSTEVELPSTSSPSRFHLLSTDLEEGEVEMENESPSSDEESSVESKAAFEKKKQMEKQKLGKNKNKQTNHASSRSH
ncbi:BnaCnng09460D [Brassica napus]|uniref:BnaCnng09460D protein n=2 Tax=Brassica napus TaxID=3708 RepID=A0A078HP08_BRANA|nr:BnaCnng09460D [Brassica napus]